MGMPLPGDEDDKYYPRGFDLEDLGPKYFEGKGRKSVAAIREQLKQERRGQAPFIPELPSAEDAKYEVVDGPEQVSEA